MSSINRTAALATGGRKASNPRTSKGKADHDLAIKTSRPEQRRIEHVGPICRGDNNDAVLRVKAVHLDEQRVECLLALIDATAEAMAARTAHRVNFINEHQARRVASRLLKHIAHAARADADKHFHKVRAADAEEAGVRLAGDGLG